MARQETVVITIECTIGHRITLAVPTDRPGDLQPMVCPVCGDRFNYMVPLPPSQQGLPAWRVRA